jgi:hypothetical protein
MTPQKPIEGHGMSPSVSTAKELPARLVAFDTTSHKTNIPLIDFVEAYLAKHGVKSHRVPTPDARAIRASWRWPPLMRVYLSSAMAAMPSAASASNALCRSLASVRRTAPDAPCGPSPPVAGTRSPHGGRATLWLPCRSAIRGDFFHMAYFRDHVWLRHAEPSVCPALRLWLPQYRSSVDLAME